MSNIRVTEPAVRATIERVRTHLLAQRRRAMSAGPVCVYRTAGDAVLKCAVGCLITDEAYDSRMEGAAIKDLEVDADGWQGVDHHQSGYLAAALTASGVPASEEMKEALRRLQHIHDVTAPTRWESDLDGSFEFETAGGD